MYLAEVPMASPSQLNWALSKNATRQLGAGRKEKSGPFVTTGEFL